MLQAFLKDDSGATAIEYGLIASLISVAIVATVINLGDNLVTTFTSVNDDMVAAIGNPVVDPSLSPVEVVESGPGLPNF